MRAAASPDTAAGRRRSRTHLVVLAGMVALAALLFIPALLDPTRTLVGATTADNSQHAWFLRWLPHALASGHNPLDTANMIAPTGVNLMWNTWIPLPALVLSPITLLAGPVAAFDVAMVVGVALSAWCAYLAASRYVRRTSAAVMAGAAYGFSPFILDQAYTGHSNMVIAFVPPLLVLAIDTWLVRQDVPARRAGLVLGALLVAQLYVTEELLASEAVIALVVAACVAAQGRAAVGARLRYAARALGTALVVVVPLTAYPLWFQFFGPGVPTRVLTERNFFVTDLLNVVLPSTAQGFEPSFAAAVAAHYAGNSGEWGGYVGLPMLAVAIWTAWQQWSRPLVRTVAVTSAVALVLSFGSTLHVGGTDTRIPLPGAILEHLPIVDNLLPARFAVYVALGTALLLGAFIDSLPADRRGWRVMVTTAVLVAVTFVPPLPFPTRTPPVPAYFAASPSPIPPGTVALVVPFSHDFYSTQAVLWQAASGIAFSMPEGYIFNRQPSGVAGEGPPPSTTSSTLAAVTAGTSGATVSAATRHAILAELRSWGVSEVVLGPMDAHGDVMRAFLVNLLGGEPVDRDGVAVWARLPPRA